MKTALMAGLVLQCLSVSAIANTWIEHPDKKLAKKEAATLKRAIKISTSKAACSGVWYQEGIVITDVHCRSLIEGDKITINGIQTTVLDAAVFVDESAAAAMENPYLADYILSGYEGTPMDMMIVGVDPAPLENLVLPKEPIVMAPAMTAKVPAGTEMMIAGWGFTDDTLPDEVQASMVNTSEVPADSDFSLMLSATRSIEIDATCTAGNYARFCKITADVVRDKRQKDSMTAHGDSGGPAFTKDANGNWQLQGICTGGDFHPNDQVSGDVDFSWGRKNRSVRLDLTNKAAKSNEKFFDHVMGRIYFVMQNLLKLDLRLPLEQDFEAHQKYTGQLVGYHVNFSDPSIRAAVLETVKVFEKARNANQGQILAPVKN